MSAYRKDIDGLRAVAVLPVVLYHAGVSGVPGGFVGVDVFFVISGYLITRIIRDELESNSFSILGFYERRARRILPALFFMLAASLVAGWFILMPDGLVSLAKSALATTVFSSNFWFWRETGGGYFAEASEYFPLLHTWSLAVEEQFYILFPLLLMAVSGRGRSTAIVLTAGLVIASFLISVIAVERWPSAAFYLAPTRAWELGLGAWIAQTRRPWLVERWHRDVAAVCGITAITYAVAYYDKSIPFPGLNALLPCLGATAILVAGEAGSNMVSSLLSWRPFVFLGTISYSLYLWHWPILSFLRSRLGSVELSLLQSSAAVIAAVAVATFSWAFVERPFRSRTFLRRATVFLLSVGAMASSVVVTATLWAGSGMPSRLSPELPLIVAGSQDINPLQAKCFSSYPDPSFADHLCQIGVQKGGPIDFLFWGDSHSDALFPGMDLAAKAAGRTGLFAGASSCAPLLKVDRVAPFEKCRAFNDAILAKVLERSDVRTVVLYARWASKQRGEAILGEPGGPPIMTDDQHRIWRKEDAGAIFAGGLRRTVDALVSSGRRVVILGGTPEFGWHVPKRLFAAVRFGDPLPTAPTLVDVTLRNAGVDEVFRQLVEEQGVEVIPLAPILCKPECLLSYKGHPLYVDDDHLSAFAARELIAPYLVSTLFEHLVTYSQSLEPSRSSVLEAGATPY